MCGTWFPSRACRAPPDKSGEHGSAPVTLKVWIDRQGGPRQVDETFAAGGSYLSTLVQFGGYGQAVLVQAPPSSLVRPTRGAIRPNPLGAGPGPLLAPLLFFNAGTAHAPARQIPTPTP